MDRERLCRLALHLIPGLGNASLRKLLDHFGDAQSVFEATPVILKSIKGIRRDLIESFFSADWINVATTEIEIAENGGAQLLVDSDQEYPERLKNAYGAPPLLFVKGNCDLNARKVVAIVGTRRCTDYGTQVLNEIVTGLSPQEPVIVSGLAYGIDILSHRRSIEMGLPTVAVIAGGIDRIYPARHKRYIPEIIGNGAVVTEHPFGEVPDPQKFPARNRIIAGMADVTIVVESAARGGSLITAEFANQYDREVFAVPGDLHRKESEGCNNLLRDHKARIYTRVQDIIEAMNWDLSDIGRVPNTPLQLELDPDLSKVLEVVYQGPVHIEHLIARTGLELNPLMTVLLELELKGLITSLPGNEYRRTV